MGCGNNNNKKSSQQREKNNYKWTSNTFYLLSMNYELNWFIFKMCELNFELVHVESELSQHCLKRYST